MARRIALWGVVVGVRIGAAKMLSSVGGRRGALLRGRMEAIADRYADHAVYWQRQLQRFPDDSRFLRAKCDAALRKARIGDAEMCIDSLARKRAFRLADIKLIQGLINAYDRLEDLGAARRVIRVFLKDLRGSPEYRIAALKICRTVFVHFRRRQDPDTRRGELHNRAQINRMLSHAQIRAGSNAILQRVIRCEEMLGEQSAVFLPDTDISRAQSEAFVHLVRSRLVLAEPFSFVRLGDGEAACLSYEPQLEGLAAGDAKLRERIWWGRTLTATERREATRLVSESIWRADCLGIPTVSRFIRELNLERDDCLVESLTGRGLRAILYHVERRARGIHAMSLPALITSCHVHQDLARWDLYPELFGGGLEIVLVSCHDTLADYMESKYRVRVVKDIVVPPDCVTGPALSERFDARPKLPSVLQAVEPELATWPHGRLVLVGAGYLGKWLVDRARARGGIALDLGSIFDQWLGLTTRSYLDMHAM